MRNLRVQLLWLVAVILLAGCRSADSVAADRAEHRRELLRLDLEHLMAKHGVDVWAVVEALGPGSFEVPCLPLGGLGPVDDGILVNFRGNTDEVILRGRPVDLGTVREGGRLAVVSSNGLLGQVDLAPSQETNVWLIAFGKDQVRFRRLMDPTVFHFTRSPEKR